MVPGGDGVIIQKMRRATSSELSNTFHKYASIEENGRKYMMPEDFLVKYLGLPLECQGIGSIFFNLVRKTFFFELFFHCYIFIQ